MGAAEVRALAAGRRPSLRCVVSTSNWKSTSASSRLVSTWLPLPVTPRRTSAARMPCAAAAPASMSATARPNGTGPWSSSPFSHITPERDCASRSWPGPLHPRAFLAIAADRGIDEPRIDLPDRLVVEAEPLDDAGPEILDQHVGLGEQRASAQSRSPASLRSIGKAFLGAVDGVEDGRVAADLGVAEIEPPRQVAAIRPLDLDDAGAEVEQPSEQ